MFGELDFTEHITEKESKRLVKPLLGKRSDVVDELAAHLSHKISFKGRDHRTPQFLQFEAGKWFDAFDLVGSGWNVKMVNRATANAIREVMPMQVEEQHVAEGLFDPKVDETVSTWREGVTRHGNWFVVWEKIGGQRRTWKLTQRANYILGSMVGALWMKFGVGTMIWGALRMLLMVSLQQESFNSLFTSFVGALAPIIGDAAMKLTLLVVEIARVAEQDGIFLFLVGTFLVTGALTCKLFSLGNWICPSGSARLPISR